MVDMSARKRARTLPFQRVETEHGSSPDYDNDTVSTASLSDDSVEDDHLNAPKGFFCPLTMEIMADPVLDAEGNTFERIALMEWLKEHRTSPVSRQPLCERMVKSNNALRDAIHEYMGTKWVSRKEAENRIPVVQKSRIAAHPDSPNREKIDCFLQFTSQKIGGLALKLNERGCCAFRYDGITIVLDVPDQAGVFCLYTRNLVPELTDSMKDLLLELNFLQGETRGGCLSVKKNSSEQPEVVFSYTDRVAEICAQDFLNIILNFVETAVSLRSKLMTVVPSYTVIVSGTHSSPSLVASSMPMSSVPMPNASMTLSTTPGAFTRSSGPTTRNSSQATAAIPTQLVLEKR